MGGLRRVGRGLGGAGDVLLIGVALVMAGVAARAERRVKMTRG